jgi:DNA-binding GntR family transcriptional regulator
MAVREKMLTDYANDQELLRREKQESLAARYGCSRETAKKARVWALDQLQHKSGITPTIDK